MKLRNLLLLVVSLLSFYSLKSQIEEPVTWSFESKQLSDNKYELQFIADIDEGWHMYSQYLADGGPIPTTFIFTPNDNYQLIDSVVEPKSHSAFDENFQVDVAYFDGKTVFKQLIKVDANTTIEGEIEFMVCDDAKCLPPELIPFKFDLKQGKNTVFGSNNKANNLPPIEDNIVKNDSQVLTPVSWTYESKSLGDDQYELIFRASIDEGWHLYSQHISLEDGPATAFKFEESDDYQLEASPVEDPKNFHNAFDPMFETKLGYFENEAVFRQKVNLKKTNAKVKGYLTYMVCDDQKCLSPEDVEFSFDLGKVTEINESVGAGSSSSNIVNKSLLSIFVIAFLSGLAALLTPCVFPMIPMTVSFFTKQSKTKAAGIRNAIFYGLSIIIIYVFLGSIVTLFVPSDTINEIATGVGMNIFFFLLLIVFAVSFLGAFEITLPSSWINKADQASDRGGLIGIFFMGLVLALVSFSCTGPIVGSILVESATRGGIVPVVGMLGFSSALALPFGLFAAFPGWMNSLPKSGGWLNTVKVVLGFLELAFAFKFLSNADLVLQLHWLEREVFLAIWIAIFGILAIYLFGGIRMPHDSPLEQLSVGRTLLGIVTVAFVIYLIPGLWGAPLKLISGFPPPMTYSESPNGIGKTSGRSGIGDHDEGQHPGPQGLAVFHDYDEGVIYAKKVGKPILLDFTGHACVNCRKMEEKVWGEPGVIGKLRNELVIISLYVDDKRDLPLEEQKEVMIGSKTKKLRTIGNKWSYLQATRYKTNTQPYYVMLDTDGKDLDNGSADYEHHGNVADFSNWLKKGLKSFKDK